jgi:lipoprotein NlpD
VRASALAPCLMFPSVCMHPKFHSFRLLTASALVLTLVGCASPLHKAPVEDRGRVATGLSTVKPPAPGAENAGKPGYYTVKSGDTLIRVALESGQNWRDVAAWNNLENPNLIEVGQVLRVVPPEGVTPTQVAAPVLAATKPVSSSKIESRNLDAKGASSAAAPKAAAASGASAASGAASAASSASGASASASAAAAPVAAAGVEVKDSDEPAWVWPSSAPIIGNFEEGKRKGMVFGGKAGDPVLAAADGRVVYAGSGLRGYGNLVIIKHNANYLTAYAHNQTLLVKEDQAVKKGQKIAEMGSTDAERVQLHFEVRKQGKPIDPAKSLPSR